MRYVYAVLTTYNYGKLGEKDKLAGVCSTEAKAKELISWLNASKPHLYHSMQVICMDNLTPS